MIDFFQNFDIDHIGIAVKDLQTGSLPYETLGLSQIHEDEFIESNQVLVRSFKTNQLIIELLAPANQNSPIQAFLDKKGPGLHHIAFKVNDILSEIDRLQHLGAVFIGNKPKVGRANTSIIFLHPKWGQGVLIELVQYP